MGLLLAWLEVSSLELVHDHADHICPAVLMWLDKVKRKASRDTGKLMTDPNVRTLFSYERPKLNPDDDSEPDD